MIIPIDHPMMFNHLAFTDASSATSYLPATYSLLTYNGKVKVAIYQSNTMLYNAVQIIAECCLSIVTEDTFSM